MALQEELSQLQAQGMRHVLELNNIKMKLEEARAAEHELHSKKTEMAKLLEDSGKDKKELEKISNILLSRNAAIQRLKDEIRKRDSELDSKDEENTLRVRKVVLIS